MPLPKYAHLALQLVRRDIQVRFTGSALGLAWAVLQPISLVALYWFVFTTMLPVGRYAGAGDDYVFFLISGLLPWMAFSEGVVRSSTSVVDNSPVVKRLPFHSEVLVFVPNATALVFEVVALAVFAVVLVAQGYPASSLWLLPFALLLQFGLQVGIGLILAPVHVLFRDVAQLLGFALSVLFYLSPILYSVRGRFESIFQWNPFTPLLGLFRSAMLAAPLPETGSIVFLLAAVVGLIAFGLFLFRKAQPTFADLI